MKKRGDEHEEGNKQLGDGMISEAGAIIIISFFIISEDIYIYITFGKFPN